MRTPLSILHFEIRITIDRKQWEVFRTIKRHVRQDKEAKNGESRRRSYGSKYSYRTMFDFDVRREFCILRKKVKTIVGLSTRSKVPTKNRPLSAIEYQNTWIKIFRFNKKHANKSVVLFRKVQRFWKLHYISYYHWNSIIIWNPHWHINFDIEILKTIALRRWKAKRAFCAGFCNSC